MKIIGISPLRFLPLKRSTSYAFYCALGSLVIGVIGSMTSIAAEHLPFFLTAPLSTYIVAWCFWKLTISTEEKRVLLLACFLSVFVTLFSYYLNFVLLGLIYGVEDYISSEPISESILGTFTYISLTRTLIALYLVGIYSLILNTLAGYLVLKTS